MSYARHKAEWRMPGPGRHLPDPMRAKSACRNVQSACVVIQMHMPLICSCYQNQGVGRYLEGRVILNCGTSPWRIRTRSQYVYVMLNGSACRTDWR